MIICRIKDWGSHLGSGRLFTGVFWRPLAYHFQRVVPCVILWAPCAPCVLWVICAPWVPSVLWVPWVICAPWACALLVLCALCVLWAPFAHEALAQAWGAGR